MVEHDQDSKIEHEVVQLARTMTSLSQRQQQVEQGHTPFSESADPKINPLSETFDYQVWLRSLLQITSRDPGRYPARTAGVSFTNLSVHGYGTATDHQKTVGNVLLDIPDMFWKFLTQRKGQKIDILRDFQGVLQQGEMLVVLGPPGSGCTTLLKTISGESHGFYIDEATEINYQGISFETMHKDFRGEVVYSAETDTHFPDLTVGQTLEFAAKARTPRARLPGVTREQWATHMKDVVMAIFGLKHTEHTKVGNDFIRGVSGGERKRVSVAEVVLSGSPLHCWDNSTRGLDSATALEFTKVLRLTTRFQGAAAVVAIYQASQDIYDLFDKVTVLYDGRQIYFGRINDAKKFFVDVGFECPDRQTTADFLTSLTNPSERKARPGFENLVPRTADEFVKLWKESEDHKKLLQEIADFNREHPIRGEQLQRFRNARSTQQARGMRAKSPYTISVPMQVKLCLVRGFNRLRGDLGAFIGAAIGNFLMAIVVASVFFNLPEDTSSFFSRGVLIFWAVLLCAFATALELMTLYEQRPIVEKHSRMALYHPASEAIASMICGLPSKIIHAITFNLALYFMTNLRREPAAFFTYFLFSFTCTMCMSMIFRTIGSSSRSISQAMAPAALFTLALVTYTGFIIPTRDMKPWFRWIAYINPVSYAFEALMANEFDGREFPCTNFVPEGPGYEDITGLERICSTKGAEPGSATVSGTDYIATSFQYYRSNMWRNYGILLGFMVFFCVTHLLTTEFISAAKSKGEVLIFRRADIRNAKKPKKTDDAEAAIKMNRMTESEEKSVDNISVAAIERHTSTFHWENVVYDIKIKKETRRLLDNVDGWVQPGTLTALMGASGAGKTTLLDTLASRVSTGIVSGDMLIDGYERDSSFQRKTGYVQQQDLHLQTSTVREALVFSARLRQPRDVPDTEKLAYVEEVIQMLNMEVYADAVVGVPGEGLNVEQRKRLTIGVELAAKPALLLFLDEPTSGLDSQTAWSIIALLRKLANSGQAILCTIHQPSALLFQEFDRLLLLQRGGRPVYFGDIGKDSSTLIRYFESQGAKPCPPDANPAEWMLQVIGAAPGAVAVRDYADAWRESKEFSEMKKELASKRNIEPTSLSAEQGNNGDLVIAPFAASFGTQLSECTYRVFQQYWRTPTYLYSKMALCILAGAFIGFSVFKADNSIQGLQTQMFAVFMLLSILDSLAGQLLPQFVTQRSLYEVRERPSKTYSWQAFMASNIVAELPWNLLMALALFCTWYYPIGLYRNAQPTNSVKERGGLMFLLIWQLLVFMSTFTHMIIAGLDTAQGAGSLASLLLQFCIVFCGVLATPEVLPGFWIFMYRLSPFTYLVDAILSVGVANTAVECSDIELSIFNPPAGQTCGQYLEAFLTSGGKLFNPESTSDCSVCSISETNTYLETIHSSYSHRWRNFGILWAYIGFNICAAFFFYWLARVPKGSRAKTPEA